jgi:hypothetical protein
MRTIQKDIYRFSELTKTAQDNAIKHTRNDEYYLSHEWYLFVNEDFKAILDLIGFYNIETRFSGFQSQGDGASFKAGYSNNKYITKKIKNYVLADNELNQIISNFQDIKKSLKNNAKDLEFEIRFNSHHYCHSNTMSISGISYFAKDFEDDILQLCKDLANWYYKKLDDEYEFLNSDKEVAEHLICSEYEFEINGKMT